MKLTATFSYWPAAVLAFVVVLALVLAPSQKIEANNVKTLPTSTYKTASGTIVEIVKVPGFGTCLFSSGYWRCNK